MMSIFNFDHCSGVDLDYSIVKSECTEKSSKIGKSWPHLKT